MLPLLIGAGAGLASSLIGASSASSDREQAMQLIAQSLKDYESMGIPPVEAQKLVLDEFKSAGRLTPELEQMVSMGPSKVGEIALDPGYKTAQLRALDELQAIGDSGGLRLSDQASLEEALSKARQQERGSREAILANRRERGISGSGSELAAQLANQQNSAENAYKSGLDIAGKAQDRALQAIMQGGQLAGDIRGQDYDEKLNAARAADEIAKFNAQNQIDMGARNVDRNTDVNKYNLSEAQRIADANTGIRNQQEQYNKELLQKNFNNNLALNEAKANARAGQASNAQQSANATQQMWGGIGQGIGQLGTSLTYADILKKKKDEA